MVLYQIPINIFVCIITVFQLLWPLAFFSCLLLWVTFREFQTNPYFNFAVVFIYNLFGIVFLLLSNPIRESLFTVNFFLFGCQIIWKITQFSDIQNSCPFSEYNLVYSVLYFISSADQWSTKKKVNSNLVIYWTKKHCLSLYLFIKHRPLDLL